MEKSTEPEIGALKRSTKLKTFSYIGQGGKEKTQIVKSGKKEGT